MWSPSRARPPKIDEAPTFYPTIEEFHDPLGYIAKIRPQAEHNGICKIVPPTSWVPPCPFKERDSWENSKFPTRIQQVNFLQNREPIGKKIMERKRKHGRLSTSEEEFGFRPGPDFNLKAFQHNANVFKENHFMVNHAHHDDEGNSHNKQQKRPAPSVEEIEGEYWRIIEESTDAVEVYYGTDFDIGSLGSGFPKTSSSTESDANQQSLFGGWNLSNLARLPGSALCYEDNDIPRVSVPRLCIGMCFSTTCWYVDVHHLYSVNYLHSGDPTVWYGVPGSHATALEETVRKELPALFAAQPDLLNDLVTQFSPSILTSAGLPVYRIVQNPGEIVLTFPRAYHAGFSCGFNFAEAVNVAPVDWFMHGQVAVELYSQQRRKTSFSHDKVLFGAAEDAVLGLAEKILDGETLNYLKWTSACGKGGVLTEAVKTRMMMEIERLRSIAIHSMTKLEMDKYFDFVADKECISCFYDLHQSAIGCQCSPDRYSCLQHSNKLCKCEMKKKVILYRYSVSKLSSLVAALEGEEHAIEAWAKINIGVVSANDEDEQHMERAMSKKNNKEKGESSTFIAGTSEKYNPNAVSSSYNHVSSELVHPGSHHEPLSTPDGVIDLTSDDDEPDNNHFKGLIESAFETVEVLSLGSVISGKLWSSKHAIYPKGFKSRFMFFSTLDPANLCAYVCEVIDASLLGPVFKVTMESHPNEIFTQTSAEKCWETVLEKLVHEIKRRESLGEKALPPLELLQSTNGHKMFGFLSPSIIQSIEAQDPGHKCVEYWNHKGAVSEAIDSSTSKAPHGPSNSTQGVSAPKLFGVSLVKF